MLKESLVEVGYQVLSESKSPLKFNRLWDKVAKHFEFGLEEKGEYVSKFYTKLTLDQRFVLLEDNTWDLRDRQSFDKVHIDMNEIYSELENEEQELVAEQEEDKVYDEDITVTASDEEDNEEEKEDEEEEEY